MIEALAILFMCIAAVTGTAAAINYFWQTGIKAALGYAAFFTGVIIIFWASGLWSGASRHAWGVLTPIFLLMILACWLAVKYLPGISKKIYAKIREKIEDKDN